MIVTSVDHPLAFSIKCCSAWGGGVGLGNYPTILRVSTIPRADGTPVMNTHFSVMPDVSFPLN